MHGYMGIGIVVGVGLRGGGEILTWASCHENTIFFFSFSGSFDQGYAL